MGKRTCHPCRSLPRIEPLEPRLLLDASVIITEFMAINQSTLADQQGDYSDWIELQNTGPSTVNLAGWHLTDDPDLLQKWHFPSVNLASGAFLTVFASDKNTIINGELHTNFKLDGGGEYLALVKPDGVTRETEFAPTFPPQEADYSYGLSETTNRTTILPVGATAKVLIPTNGLLGTTWTTLGFNDTGWTISGPTGIGFESTDPSFQVLEAKSATGLGTINDAVNLLAGGGTSYTAPFLNFADPEDAGGGRFIGNLPFPGNTTADDDNFALKFTGTIKIPTAGNWTFDVNSDDGFRLRIVGGTFKSVAGTGTTISGDTMQFAGGRGAADSLGVIALAAGEYAIELVYFEGAGGSSLEFSAAQGSYSSVPTPSPFRLVGDTRNGGLALKGIGDLAATNVQAAMKGANATAYIRIPFTTATAADRLNLRMQYDDGFVAYLDGVAIARASAPTTPAWNSTATAARPLGEALAYADFDIRRPLAAGSHVLAIQGLNVSAGDADFLVVPHLEAVTVIDVALRHFATASPGAPNSQGIVAFVADTQFSDTRGFYTGPVDVAIRTATAGAEIRYTLDSSTPTPDHGFVYTGPIRIDRTTTLRARAFKAGWEPTNTDTQTYLFVSDIVTQSLNGQPPAGWPAGPINGQTLDYGVDPDVVNDPRYRDLIDDALLAIPSISIVTDLPNLFDPATGIYVNAGQDGAAWERAASIELINPDGSKGFQIDAGLRIRGGYSRSGGNPKHAFRLLFKAEYGDAKLKFPLFGDEGVSEFDNIDLRTSQNYSWSFDGGNLNIMVRDVFNRDVQRAQGQPYTRSRFYNLYIDGQYWGLYQTQERSEASYAASYFGGQKEDYDVVKVTDGYVIGATDGDLLAWQRLWTAATAGFGTDAAYYRVQGLNPDGTRNPAYEVQVDVDNLIDYMIGIYWSGDLDAPISNFLGNNAPNNFYGIRNRDGQSGWQFFRHDGEHTLRYDGGELYRDRTGPFPAGTQFQHFNAQWLHQQLTAHPEYVQRFADRVQKWMFNGGPLSTEGSLAIFNARVAEIETAIIGESARWGDSKAATPRTKDDDWLPAINSERTIYMPQRPGIVLAQLKAKGWYPNVVAPTLNQHGGTIPSQAPWFQLTMSAPAGTIYYTLDGTDPRLKGGAVSPAALVYSGAIPLTRSTTVKARVRSGGVWSALDEATFVRDQPPALRITEILYHPLDPPLGSLYIDDDFQFIEVQNTGTETLNLNGFGLAGGVEFHFPNMQLTPGAYTLVVANPTAFESRYGTGFSIAGQFTGNLAHAGEPIQLLGSVGETILDFQYKDGWYDQTDGLGFSLAIRDAAAADRTLWNSKTGWRASRASGGSPNAIDIDYDPGAVLINEVLAHQDTEPPGDWVELWNTTGAAIDLGGWYLSDDAADPAKFRIPPNTVVLAGQYVVFTESADFGNAGNPCALVPFRFSELGDTACLTRNAPDGTPGGYRESETFDAGDRDVTLGRYIKSTGGKDFVAMSGQTRGGANAYPLVGPVVINEIMYNPPLGGDEFVELYNPTGADVPLYDPARPANTWRFTQGLGSGMPYALPAGATIPAHGYALVVGIDPAVFRLTYAVPPSVPIYGPYLGWLSNDSEPIELARPGDPEPDTGFVPYYRVDRVSYDDEAPWPLRADGEGSALGRVVATAYGNDVANWVATTAGGTPGAANMLMDFTPPTVPTGLAAAAAGPARIDLAWTASSDPETGVAFYRVFRNGLVIGTSPTTTYSDPTAQPGITYTYQVSAVNPDEAESGLSAPPAAARIVTLQSVGSVDPTTLRVVFTETVGRAAAETLANYSLTYPVGQSVPIAGISLAADNRTATLALGAPLAFNTTYTLTVRNLVGGSGYALAPNSQKTFTYALFGTGTILREWWTGINGTAVSNLTSNANYPNSPTGRSEQSLFEAPTDWADFYGTRMRGYVTVPVTGGYVFWIASDDASELWLNLNGETEAGKVRIAYVAGWTSSREWTREATQSSAVAYGAITLQGGQRYYIEALQKEGGGGDNLAVGWQLPDGTLERPIPGLRLSPYLPPPDVTVSLQATDAVASEPGLDTATFTVTRTGNLVPAVTVYYTVSGTAQPSDYQALSGFVTIPGGAASTPITLRPLDDSADEPNETVILTLTGGQPTYALGSPTTAQAVIIDNDLPTVSLAATDPSASEAGPDKGTFTISRVGDLAPALTVRYTVGGTAQASDYEESLTGLVTIPAGQPGVPIDITPRGDAENEPGETVILTLADDAAYTVGTRQATVTIADSSPPQVTAITVNGLSDHGASGIDPSGRGIRTIAVRFSKLVTFVANDVLVQTVTFPGGAETPASVASLRLGSGTNTLTISFVLSPAVDTWVKVTLSGSGTLVGPGGVRLDGEPRAGGSGVGYIFSNAADLPTGNGVAGGNAVFYVGSLRGDFAAVPGETPPHRVTEEDVGAFLVKYGAGDPDADFRGAGFGAGGPDGRITPSDFDGFISTYEQASAADRHLDALPSGSPQAEGTPEPLPPCRPGQRPGIQKPCRGCAPAYISQVASDAAVATVTDSRPAMTAGADSPDALPAPVIGDNAVSDASVAPSLQPDVPLLPSASPQPSAAADPALDADGGLVDLLAAAALEIPLAV